MITSVLDKSAGFYSVLFFTINHYIHCKKNNKTFKLDDSNWLFKSVNGWTDYFKTIDFEGGNDTHEEPQVLKHNQLAGNFLMWDYQDIIRNHLYLYNDEVAREIREKKTELGLVHGEYDAIFIRRGDKLCCESKFIDTNQYVELLLRKNPNCCTIFVQTDDYNVFLDVEKYVKTHNLNIRVVTMCDPNTRGMVIFDKVLSVELNNVVIRGNQMNQQYFETIYDDLKKFTPVEKMNSEQIYRHTVDMLIGVDIVLHSKYCILDNQSNVSRFISVAHNDYTKLFDVRYPNENINMGWSMCPAYW